MSQITDVLLRYDFQPLWPEHQIRPTEELVRELEHVTGTYLPEDYRSFLLQYGAIRPSGEKSNFLGVPVPGRDCMAHIFGFMGFFRADSNHPGIQNSDLIQAYRDWCPIVGVSFLPICKGVQHQVFVLKLSGERIGSIWAWTPDPVQGETWEAMVQVYGLYCVASDIASFVSAIQDDPSI
jgi:SMI1 / KNR4 family (SUKH-1)